MQFLTVSWGENLNIILIISLILFIVSDIFGELKKIQMYQQNSYFLKRFYAWEKENGKKYLIFTVVITAVSILFVIFKWYIPLLILSCMELAVKCYTSINTQKKAIKKLVFTARIKRLITASVILSLIVFVLSLIFAKSNLLLIIFTLAIILSAHFPFVKVFITAFLMTAVEKSVARYYYNDAKKILKSNKDLLTIGVTGSYGKTSVKFILQRILNEKFNVVATPESFNTPMGIIRTVREKLTPSTQIFIAEMGAKNIGDIKELCVLAEPQIGIITAVGPQHLESFKTIENIQKTKFELADYCKNIYVNFESEYAKEKAGEYVPHSYGLSNTCETYAENIEVTEFGTEFDVVTLSGKFHLTTKLLGVHNVVNILGAVSIALSLGVTEKQIRFAVSSLAPTPHRLEKKAFMNGSVLLDDSYNSNPVGSVAAVNVLKYFNGKKKIVVTPGMVEHGEKEYEYNYNLGKEIANVSDFVILVGEKRSIPLLNGLKDAEFNEDSIAVVKTFKDCLPLLNKMCNENTVTLFENDLPDNYAK